MKKIQKVFLGVVCALILVSVPGAAVAQATPTPYEELLPAKAVIVVTIPDFAELKSFLGGAEFAKLLEITGTKASVDEGVANFVKQFNKETGLDANRLYDGIVGDLTLCISKLDLSAGDKGAEVAVLVGMKGGDAEIWSLLRAIHASAAEKSVQGELIKVAGTDVYQFPDDVFLTAYRGHLVIANNTFAVESLIGKGPKLNSSPRFARHMELAKLHHGVVAYVDFAPFMPMLTAVMQPSPSPAADESGEGDGSQSWKEVVKALEIDKLESLSIQLPIADNGPLTVYLQAHDYHGMISKFISGTPVGNRAAQMPADSDAFMAITINRPLDVFNSIIDIVQQYDPSFQPAMMESGLTEFKTMTGLDFRQDILAPLGDVFTFGIRLNPDKAEPWVMNPLAIFNQMEFEICLSLADETAFRATVDKVLAQAGQAITVEQHGDATIYTPNVPGLPLNPSVALYKGQLRCATFGAERMKAVIDQIATGKLINSHPDFAATMSVVPADAWAVGYASRDYLDKWVDISLAQFTDTDDATTKAMMANFAQAKGMFLGGVKSTPSFVRILPDGLYSETRYSLKTFLYMMAIELPRIKSAIANMGHDADDEEAEDDDDDGEAEVGR